MIDIFQLGSIFFKESDIDTILSKKRIDLLLDKDISKVVDIASKQHEEVYKRQHGSG